MTTLRRDRLQAGTQCMNGSLLTTSTFKHADLAPSENSRHQHAMDTHTHE